METGQIKRTTRPGNAPVYFLAFLTFIAGCAVSSCARFRHGPPPRVYEGPLVEVRRLDTSCLKDKRIVLDPGHGGAFSGAIGSGGLREAQVNLGVALYLWGLLRDAGAEVFLTRSSDRDFLRDEKSSLRDDLSGRVEAALAFDPDLFVSLHHNADISRSRDRNDVETYFKMLDEGPSRDVALLVHRHLTESLGIPKGEVVAGNYFVLRNMSSGAILGEPSYLTNPWVEEKLKLAEKQLLEAQAYFLGILEYFCRGVPRVASLSPCDTVVVEARPALAAVFLSEKSPVDTSTVVLKLDGVRVARSLPGEGQRVEATPDKPLASGRHELCVSCRNLNGNSSGERCCHFDVLLPPFSLVARVSPECLPRKGGVLVTARSTDSNGNPVSDGTFVEFSGRGGFFVAESVATLGGVATSVFFAETSASEKFVRAAVRNQNGTLSLRDSVVLEPCPAAEGVTTRAIRVVADSAAELLDDARLWNGDNIVGVSSPQGLLVFKTDSTEGLVLERRGFIPVPVAFSAPVSISTPGQAAGAAVFVDTRDLVTVRMKPVASGVFRNARIAIDVGPSPRHKEQDRADNRTGAADGTEIVTDSFVAEVAARLQKILRGAGAQVVVVDETRPDEEKVRTAELFGAGVYLRIERSSQKSVSLLHYPGSSSGVKLAQEISRWWGEMLHVREPSVREDAHYVLRQTGCPAVVATVPLAAGYADRGTGSAIAYALFLAIAEDLGLRRDQLARLTVKTGGRVSSDSLDVVLDDFVSLPVVAGNGVTFVCEEGQHLVEVRTRVQGGLLRFVSLKKGTKSDLELTLQQATTAGQGTRGQGARE